MIRFWFAMTGTVAKSCASELVKAWILWDYCLCCTLLWSFVLHAEKYSISKEILLSYVNKVLSLTNKYVRNVELLITTNFC